jgi:hypothetical protein
MMPNEFCWTIGVGGDVEQRAKMEVQLDCEHIYHMAQFATPDQDLDRHVYETTFGKTTIGGHTNSGILYLFTGRLGQPTRINGISFIVNGDERAQR